MNGYHDDTQKEDHDAVEPIAIIGFSLKFPGEASSAEGFWEMLEGGRNVMTEFPPDRINLEGHYHPDNARLDEV
jgi:acyl transferase domain-containing protein